MKINKNKNKITQEIEKILRPAYIYFRKIWRKLTRYDITGGSVGIYQPPYWYVVAPYYSFYNIYIKDIGLNRKNCRYVQFNKNDDSWSQQLRGIGMHRVLLHPLIEKQAKIDLGWDTKTWYAAKKEEEKVRYEKEYFDLITKNPSDLRIQLADARERYMRNMANLCQDEAIEVIREKEDQCLKNS